MTKSLPKAPKTLSRTVGVLAGAAVSGAALAHPGHGASVFHQHGDWLLALLALCAVGGLVWHLARDRDDTPGR